MIGLLALGTLIAFIGFVYIGYQLGYNARIEEERQRPPAPPPASHLTRERTHPSHLMNVELKRYALAPVLEIDPPAESHVDELAARRDANTRIRERCLKDMEPVKRMRELDEYEQALAGHIEDQRRQQSWQ